MGECIKMECFFVGTCINPPFENLDHNEFCDLIDEGEEVELEEFIENCMIDDADTLRRMILYPHDYEYFKGQIHDIMVYWFTHSGIEHFYSDMGMT